MEGETGPVLTIPDFVDELVGRYHCRVSNSAGLVMSRAIDVALASPPGAGTGAGAGSSPEGGQPVAISRVSDDVTLAFGDTMRLEVVATGSGPLTYQWHMDTPAYGRMAMQDETQPVLVVADVFDDLAGLYTCHVTNGHGTVVSRAVRVSVLPATR